MRSIRRIYSAAPPAFDKRRSPRHLVRHLGKILSEQDAFPHPCLIEEVSDDGVRIRTTPDFAPPGLFTLRYAGKEAEYRVTWRKGQLVGAQRTHQPASPATTC